ncbi:MAG: alpha/beta hydrolase [Kiloniellales bacterium]|nr:alpha/beta hydrolase [Kiloniellales bacterium]
MGAVKKHGEAPYRVAVVHGGPGAAGEMAPVARALAAEHGVLEPHQSATSVTGQIDELAAALQALGSPSVTLVGFSWGAWLSFLLASHMPSLVRKLILIGCPPFEESYASRIHEARLRRLSEEERRELERLTAVLNGAKGKGRDAALTRIGQLTAKAEAYNAAPEPSPMVDCQAEVFLSVWEEAAALRRSGQLLTRARDIACPVVALHGDHDPHPAAGVEEPLSRLLPDFRFVPLARCGHKPWIEIEARDAFFYALRREIGHPSYGG